MFIASEQQAHAVGDFIGGDYTVFKYEHRPTRLTLFGVKSTTGIFTQDPRAAAPRTSS